MARRKRDYSRRKATKEPRARICVLTEGEVTEPEYIAALTRVLGIPKGLIELVPSKHSDPKGLVEAACELKESNDRRAKRGQEAAIDSWWVLADTESVTDVARAASIRAAKSKAASAGDELNLVLDSPSIEYWFLLHFIYTTRDFDTADEAIRELKKYMPGYSKKAGEQDWNVLVKSNEEALRNAERVRAFRESSRSERPVCDCDLLVKELIEIASSGSS